MRVSRLLAALLLIAVFCGHIGRGVAAGAAVDEGSGVAYEIFVGSFADSNGDGIGDLNGIAQKLAYIDALGVDMLWLTPISPSPSYHHYDVTDYTAIAPEFGTPNDFDALIVGCHARGIRVIIDLVVNHTGVGHPWFEAACQALAKGEDSPYIEYYCFTEGGGQHPVPGADGWYYEGQFGSHMPDLNLDSAAVRREIAGIIAFWLECGADGFRLDAMTSYYTGALKRSADFTAFVVETAKAIDPGAYIVGECWSDEQTILTLYESGVDSLFAFPFADADGLLVQATLAGNGAAVASAFAGWHEKLAQVRGDIIDAPFLTNHDLARARGMLRSKAENMKAAAMLYLMLPGRPFVYYGEELGMSGSGRDENKRLPMLWSAVDETLNCLPPADADQDQRLKEGAAEQEGDESSLLNWYRSLIALRKKAPQLQSAGAMTALDAGDSRVCAFLADDDIAVLINVSADDAVRISLDAIGIEGWTVLGAVNAGGAYDGTGEADGVLPPLSCAILSKP